MLVHQLPNDGAARRKCVAGLHRFVGLAVRVGELSVNYREIALPTRIAGVGLRQTLGYGEIVGIGFQRGFEIALRHLHIADPVVADREIALPTRIAGVGLRQTVSNGEAVGIGFQRPLKIALRQLHVADLFVADREIALPARIAGVGLREALENDKPVSI